MNTLVTAIILSSVIAISKASNIGQPIDEYFDYNGPLLGDESCSLISVVMDESGSMAIEQDFMKDTAIPSIINQLKVAGVDNVFVCIHGFGSSAHDPFGLDRGHFHGCTEGTLQGVVDSSLMESWVTEGKYEDGWQAIHYAIRDLPSKINGKDLAQTCKTMGRNMILVTDEGRYDNSCDGHQFQMEFKTDAYGAEISWTLQGNEDDMVAQDGGYRPHEVVRVSKCLHKNDNYQLKFADSNVDGFCCDNGDGYIKVWFDDDLIADSPAKFESYACVMMPPDPNKRPLNIFEHRPKVETTNYFTLENTQQKLLDTGYRLTTITILSMYGLGLDTLPLGVSSNGIIVEPDGNGSYTENNDFSSQLPLNLLDPNKMAQEYASIAFATGGSAWLLHSLREGGQSAESFAGAFLDFNLQDFAEDAFATYAPSASPSTSPSTPPPSLQPSLSPSLQPSLAPSTSTPSKQPSVFPSFTPSTSTPSELPTAQPTTSTAEERTEEIPEGVFDGRIKAHENEGDASRAIVGFATIGLLCAVGVAFLASRKRVSSKEEKDDEKDDHSIAMRQRAGDTETESLDDTEEPSSPLDVSMKSDDGDDRFALSGLARCMEFASSFRWDKDQDHMVDLSELAGEYGGGFQKEYGRPFPAEYDEGEYE